MTNRDVQNGILVLVWFRLSYPNIMVSVQYGSKLEAKLWRLSEIFYYSLLKLN